MSARKVEIGIRVTGNAGSEYKKLSNKITESNKKIVTSSKAVEQQTTKTSKTFVSSISAQQTVVVGFASLLTGKVSQSFINTQKNIDRINNALKVGTGSAAGASREFQFLEKESKRLGLELQSTALSYAQLTAAAKNTNLTSMQQREIFIGVSEAGAALGLSADDMAGALRAVQQMISKGNVQAEELRGQLGERIPGAFSLAAKAMGKTEKELNKLLETGKVSAEEMLPLLAKELRSTFGATAAQGPETLNGKINELKNTVFEFQREILENGGADLLKASFSSATSATKLLGQNIDVLTGIAKSLFLVWSAKKIMGITRAIEANYQATSISTERLGEYRTRTVQASRAQWGFNKAVKALSFVGPLLAIAAFQFAIDKLLGTMEEATKKKGGKDDFLVTPESIARTKKAALVIRELRDEVKSFEDQRKATFSRSGELDVTGITPEQENKLQRFRKAVRDFQVEAGTGFDVNKVTDQFIKGLDVIEEKLTTVKKKTKPTATKEEAPSFLFGSIKPNNEARDALRSQLGELTAIEIAAKQELDAQTLNFQEQKILRMKEGLDKELALNRLAFDREKLAKQSEFEFIEELEKTHKVEQARISAEFRESEEEKEKEMAAKSALLRAQTAATIVSGVASFNSALANLAAVRGQNELKAAEAAGASEEKINAIRKESFEKQKDFSLKSALISLAQAVLGGYSQTPFVPVGLAAGSLALLSGAVQINAIKAQKFQDGGIIQGSSLTGDKIPILGNAKERILTAAQDSNFTKLLNGKLTANIGGSGSSIDVGGIHINISGNADQSTVDAIGDTVQEKLEQFSQMQNDSDVHQLMVEA